MSSAKRRETEEGNVMAINAESIKNGTQRLEPAVVRMLVGLAVATGVIGTLVLLS